NFKDIKKVYNLLDYYHLNKSDNRRILDDLQQLETAIKKIDHSKQLIQKMETTPNIQTIKEAKEEVRELSGNFIKEDKIAMMKKIQLVESQTRKIENEKLKYKNKKIVALTFDDGPNPSTTPILLQILKEEQVPVTFFALGEQAVKYPNINPNC
ncbi:polysaccharide deacetylase family protein, partial [Lactococcus garvieae]|uniref:polysaccharide deacetylase family protein n=4 Tax=Lactococcus garvieae TaxID=1363 RepID=UPI0005A7B47A